MLFVRMNEVLVSSQVMMCVLGHDFGLFFVTL